MNRARTASRYTDDEPTTVLPPRTVIPFRGRRGDSADGSISGPREHPDDDPVSAGRALATDESGPSPRVHAPDESGPSRRADRSDDSNSSRRGAPIDGSIPSRRPRSTDTPSSARRAQAGDEPSSGRRAKAASDSSSSRGVHPGDEPSSGQRAAARQDSPLAITRRSTLRPAAALLAAPGPISWRRRLRKFASPGVLAILALGALTAIFAFGMLVGRLVTPDARVPVVAAVPTPGGDPAPPAGQPAAGPSEPAAVGSDDPSPTAVVDTTSPRSSPEIERSKEQAVASLNPTRTPAKRGAHGGKRSAGHPLAPTKKPIPSKPGASAPAPKGSDEEDDGDGADDLSAASAVDELARAQLEAVMK